MNPSKEQAVQKATELTQALLEHGLIFSLYYRPETNSIRFVATKDCDTVKRLFPGFEIIPGDLGARWAELILTYIEG